MSEFKKQFKAKAAVPWEQRVGMVAKKGVYLFGLHAIRICTRFGEGLTDYDRRQILLAGARLR